MNRTDRMLAILLELRLRRVVRAEDLAHKFETSKRTIYRDVQALSESGVPIAAVPGQGYSLMEGYFLPPVHLQPEEAILLLLGSDYMEQNFDAQYRNSARTASAKLEATMTEEQRQRVAQLRRSLRFISVPPRAEQNRQTEAALSLLRTAIMERTTVRFAYEKGRPEPAPAAPAPRFRTVDPYGLVNISGIWYLVGHCRDRRAIRHFRLDRMREPQQGTETFAPPGDFSLPQYVPEDDRHLHVVALFDDSVANRVLETRYFYVSSAERTGNKLRVTLRVRHENEVLHWLLSWGSRVKVLEPAALARKIREEAERMLYGDESARGGRS